MVSQFVRGYGLLILCSLGILGGLLLYQTYKTDVLEYSLDVVGDRLISLAPDGANREAVVAMYDAFKERVLAREVSPEQVEHVAANILNLNNSGASVTPEQAEAMLELPSLATAARDSTTMLVASHYEGDPTHYEQLGQRLKSVVDFDIRIQDMIEADPARRTEIKKQMHYECDDGIRVAMDTQVTRIFPQGDFKVLEVELKQLEKEKRIVWKENLAEEMANVRRRVRRDLEAVADFKDIQLPEVVKELRKIKALKGLEGHDYHFDEAQIKDVIAKGMKELEKNLKQLETDLKNNSES